MGPPASLPHVSGAAAARDSLGLSLPFMVSKDPPSMWPFSSGVLYSPPWPLALKLGEMDVVKPLKA